MSMSWKRIGGCAYGEYIVVGEESTEDVNSDGGDTEQIQAK